MYTVIYRVGGTEHCTWKRCLPVSTINEANKQAEGIERMGYKTLVHLTEILNWLGMPTGWEG